MRFRRIRVGVGRVQSRESGQGEGVGPSGVLGDRDVGVRGRGVKSSRANAGSWAEGGALSRIGPGRLLIPTSIFTISTPHPAASSSEMLSAICPSLSGESLNMLESTGEVRSLDDTVPGVGMVNPSQGSLAEISIVTSSVESSPSSKISGSVRGVLNALFGSYLITLRGCSGGSKKIAGLNPVFCSTSRCLWTSVFPLSLLKHLNQTHKQKQGRHSTIAPIQSPNTVQSIPLPPPL
mmetsp:Transcript_55049/g.130079  ORF Transcript_55049/g.130079 Transcript_55049/m.130079 type:complete len:236 (+) Transcript_55049:281-988(+)